MKHIIAGAFCLFLLSACAAGTDYGGVKTPAHEQANFINAYYEDRPHFSMSRWWERIDDPLLNSYVDQLLTQNLQLRQAAERVVQARERANIERGGFFPSLGGDANASRSFSPGQSGSGAASSFLPNDRIYTSSYDTGLSASWEVDLFGKIRRGVESAEALEQAGIYEREALIHALIAELLQRRIAITVNANLLELAKKNAANRLQIYDLVERRYTLGTAGSNAGDVYLAEENYTSVEADIYDFKRLLAEETYRLDVLLGQPPGTTDPLQSHFPLMPPLLAAPVCMPADLLDRRPDLKVSDLRVRAANADIGVAVADLYPALSLGGNIGFTANELNNLFTADQLAGSILGSITARLFEGGALRANIRLQESEARELAAVYAEDVLNAMREVETALKAERELGRRLEQIQNSVTSLSNAERIAEGRYRRGVQSLRDYLDTQQRRYAAEQLLLRTQQERWNTRVNLYLALGGDWLSKNSHAQGCHRKEDQKI